jgi:hypothetical protein
MSEVVCVPPLDLEGAYRRGTFFVAVLDESASMGVEMGRGPRSSRIEVAVRLLASWVAELSDGQFALVGFAEQPSLLADSRREARRALKAASPHGSATRIYRALAYALKLARRALGAGYLRAEVVCVTDGLGDEQLAEHWRPLAFEFRDAGVPAAFLHILEPEPVTRFWDWVQSPEEAEALLREFSAATGGAYFRVTTAEEFAAAFRTFEMRPRTPEPLRLIEGEAYEQCPDSEE